MLAAGDSYLKIEKVLGCDASFISRWKHRFLEQRVAGLYSRHQGSVRTVLTPELEARILDRTRQTPSDGSTHWSTRRLAKAMGINHMLVARAWVRAGLKPHRLERYMASDDPDFEKKAADVIGLYVNPPEHAAVFVSTRKQPSRP